MSIFKHLPNCKIVSTVSQTEDEAEWKTVRNKGVGGSDIGIICGVNNYTSIRSLYLQKTGQLESENKIFTASVERMYFGHVLEPLVAEEYFKRTGNKIAISPATVCHKDYPWARANIDRFLVDDNAVPIGILECKTAGANMDDQWSKANVPESYYYQVQWYLFVTGLQHAAIACLVGGQKFYYYDIPRNDELIITLFKKADLFWNYNVMQLVPPEFNGTDADTEFVNTEYAVTKSKSEIVLEDDVYNDLAATIVEIKAKIKELTKAMEEAQNRIKDKIQDNEIGITSDYIIKWSPRQQTRIDTALVKENYPEVYEQCSKKISYRVMTIKGGEMLC